MATESKMFLYNTRLNVFRIYRKLLLLLNFLKYNLFDIKNVIPKSTRNFIGEDSGDSFLKMAAIYIVDFYDNNTSLVNLFNKTLVPEEMFIHTIIMNSPLAIIVAFNDLCKLVGHKNNHPTVATSKDISILENCNSFFARNLTLIKTKRL